MIDINASLLLAETSPIVISVIIGVIAIVLGVGIGFLFFNFLPTKKLGEAKETAEKIMEDARQEAKTYRKEAILETKEEQHKLRNEFDKEIRERRSEIQRTEARLNQKEDLLEKKEESINKRQDSIEQAKIALANKESEIAKKSEDIQQAHEKMLQELQRVSGMTKEEAKSILMNNLLDEVKKEAATEAREIENNAREEAEKKAKNIIGLAIQRCAVDHSSEITMSIVPLPTDDMKGRIIGRVGRNIRAFENVTGVDLIIDDTPDVVTLSGFDPVRREIARITLEKLVSDGRIHPARIEEIVDKVKKEVDVQIKEAGEAAVFDTGIYGLHPELVKILGRLKYRTSYGQNVLKHSLEVSYLAGIMAAELGADVKVAKRAGLLHDIGKAIDHEVEGTHIQIGVDIAKKYKEHNDVIHAIAAHHNDIQPQTIEALLVQTADAISGARPGARRESLENYVKRLESLENVANSFAGVEQSYAIQAGREIRVMVKPEEVNDESTVFMAKEIAKKLEAELDYPGQIKVNVIRELRSVEYAK
ncbi:MAG: ribonuclease Y [Clostridia bacterium]|nr:ribonuclease Y [Clostridia bacterium]